MKKFLLLFLALSVIVFSSAAYGADITLTVDTERLISHDEPYYVSSDVSGDPDILVHKYVVTQPYQLATIHDAIKFANDPAIYLTNKYGAEYVINSDDVDKFANIAIELKRDDCLGDTIHFRTYSNVREVTINQSGSTRILSATGDRHFDFNGATTVTLGNLTLDSSSSGGVDIRGGTVTFTKVDFKNSTMPIDGGAVTITGGIATFDECNFENNGSSANGGAVSISGGEANFASCTFKNNNSNANGGAFNITSGTVTLNSCTFEQDHANNQGGAIFISGGGVTFNGSTFFLNNSADKGGAMYIGGGTGLTFEGTNKFENNIANNGGAMYLKATSLNPDLTILEFYNNRAIDGNGGALYLASPASLSKTFSGNFAKYNGGAIYIENSLASVTINDITFSNNSADKSGGAIYINGPATVNSATFMANSATGDGGAMYIAGGTLNFSGTNNFTSNSTTSNGGAIFINSGNNLTFTGSNIFDNNIASDRGGALYVKGGSGLAFSGTNTFRNNRADVSGGAIYVTGGTGFTFNDLNNFTSNYAPEGGAISVNGNTPIFNGVKFEDNNANHGGAVAILNGNATFANATSFENCSGDNGGAIYISSGTLSVNSDTTFTEILGNEGGIIYMTGGTANIYSSLINGKAISGDGGALYVNGNDAIANVHGSLIGNSAIANGGAISLVAGKLVISGDVEIRNNNATESGGAIYINGLNAQLDIVGKNPVTFNNNRAANGGAIYAYNGAISNFTPEVTFADNLATNGNGGALWLFKPDQVADGFVNFNNNKSNNGSGGAIYIGSTTATNVMIDYAKQYKFNQNVADLYGGAIHTLASNITLDGFFIDTTNHANVGGGFISSESGRIYITKGSSISNHWAPTGGAVYGPYVYVTSSDFINNYTEETSTENGNGGGAIYAERHLEIFSSYFDGNYASQQTKGNGGAVCVSGSSDDVMITNSLFISNYTVKGDGGALYFENITDSMFKDNTFKENSSGNDGGAIYTQGRNFTINKCYFEDNNASNNGGAVYFGQYNEELKPSFYMNYSMFKRNSATGDNGGGAVFIVTVNAKIDSCTFLENFFDAAKNSGVGSGGALYLLTTTPSENQSTIDSCTFYGNRIENGNEDKSEGGGLYLSCEKSRIRSCTFTNNYTSGYGGGAICLGSGTLNIAATIALGNTNIGRYDIRISQSASRVVTGGYNRIGKFSQGSVEADFKSVTSNNDTDRTSWLNKTWMTNKESYFGKNIPAVNNYAPDIPPSIGSSLRTGKVILLTLMLSEDKALPAEDRATNMIPYFRRSSFPPLDERGVTRARLGPNGQEIPLDIGALVFDSINIGPGSGDVAPYSVSSIQMSGLPNELRRVGQTASLLAKVYYTNGRTAYGGTGVNEEPVKWSSNPLDYYVHVDENTGDLVVLRTTASPESNTYVTIIVETIRKDSSGNTFKDEQRIKITESEFSYLNTSPLYHANYLRDLINDFIEYNLGFGFSDVSSSSVASSSFQNNFASVWKTSAFQVSDLRTTQPQLTMTSNYPASDTYVATNTKGVNIDFGNRNIGDVFPVTYTWNITGEDLTKLMGKDMSGYSLGAATAEGLFKVLRLQFQGAEEILPVIGADGVSAKEAFDVGALALNKADGNRGVQIELTAYIANVSASRSEVNTSDTTNYGAQLIDSSGSKLLVVPDGVPNDGKIYGTMWLVNPKNSSNTPDTIIEGEENSENGGVNGDGNSDSGGDGGGCNSLVAGGIIILLSCLRLIKQK